MHDPKRPKRILLAASLVAAFLLAGCAGGAGDGARPDGVGDDGAAGGDGGTGGGSATATPSRSGGPRVDIDQAGSSTVLPIAEAWAEEFGRSIGASIVVGGGGSGAGINKFCRGEIDIADASRPIRPSEADACRAAGIEPFEVEVAIDGLSVVVSRSNAFVDCLTVAQLHRMWTADASRQADRWSELDPSWPDREIELFGPGTDSGTYDYWREAIIAPSDGSSATTRSDYTASEDDNVLVSGVAGREHAVGYFGLAYYEENADRLRVVPVDEGKGRGCVEPTPQNVAAGTYSPLSRPLFMYVDGKPEGVLKSYFEAGLSGEGQDLVEAVGYIRLPQAKLDEMRAKVA
jgi:phosphate transport system substrate-binding protein